MSYQSTLTSPTRAQRTRRRTDSYDNIEPLFTELAELDTDDPHRVALRKELISRCLPLAEHIARKFAGRGENFDDLLQIARVGMVAAVDRFDPDHGASFLAFAVPTIMGEVRRHFRDHTWSVRVPRRLKEIQQTIVPAMDRLSQRLGRTPTAAEIAEELGVDLVEVTQALIARNGYRTSSIDAYTGGDSEYAPTSLLDTLGAEQSEFRTVEDCLVVKPLIAALPERDRQVLMMRFFESQSQIQIAESLGVSQMQVSRILARLLSSLREQASRD
ncbi:RNA polymerase sigma factor SigF [Nocardia sp. NBC_00565]|uniref:RNA polymerase sigma factor SigF n=1 Tax=Nocardia sp. NBC_00565 TaxID=2975993 RepID=UPI002E81FE77|nr:RNA polymerase sigma factor SigF [Nocardia sp. NBC_00565]WUC06540.1 RNA polymerase sigma factor SigF [Nocardia sp. NBC_00565]